jgi:Ribbon-helix-helix protein, copG family
MKSEHRRKGPGRPPLDDDADSVHVNVRMPPDQYDDIYERSRREGVSVPEIIRRSIQQTKKET